MKRRIRLTESDLHNIVKESVSRILREGENEKEDWKSPLDKTKENKFKVKGKMDVSGYRKKNLHGKIRKDTIGDNIDDETMKKLKKLHSENYIHKAVRESMNRMLREDERHAWELTDDGIDEFGMDSGYPTPETARRYHAVHDNDYIGRKINMARAMGQDQASGRDWMQNVHDPEHGSKFTNDDPRFRFARHYVNHGKYFPLGYSGGEYFDDNAEDDLNTFNKSERNKQAAADRRWMKAADSRSLYRKNSPNNDIPR